MTIIPNGNTQLAGNSRSTFLSFFVFQLTTDYDSTKTEKLNGATNYNNCRKGQQKTTKGWWKKLLEEGEALVSRLALGMEHVSANTTSCRTGSHVEVLLTVSTRFIIFITINISILSSQRGYHHWGCQGLQLTDGRTSEGGDCWGHRGL